MLHLGCLHRDRQGSVTRVVLHLGCVHLNGLCDQVTWWVKFYSCGLQSAWCSLC